MRNIYISLAFGVLLFPLLRCTKDLEVNDNSTAQPLNFRMEVKDGFPTFTWDATNHSGFKQYILLRSNVDTLPTGTNILDIKETPSVFGTSLGGNVATVVTRIERINDREVNTATDKATDNTPISYYRLYVVLADRIVESNTIKFEQTLADFPYCQAALIYKQRNWAIFAHNQKITIWDYENNQVVKEVEAGVSLGSDKRMTIGKEGNEEVLYFYEENIGFTRFALPSLSILSAKSSTEVLYSNLLAHDGLLSYIAAYNLVFRHQNTLDTLKTYSRTNTGPTSVKNLLLLDSASNIIVETNSQKLMKYSYDSGSGDIQPIMDKVFNSNYYTLKAGFASHQSHFFISFTTGTVFSETLTQIFNPPFEVCNGATFSLDDSLVYFVKTSFVNNSTHFELQSYSITNDESLVASNLLAYTIKPSDVFQMVATETHLLLLANYYGRAILTKIAI